MSIKNSITLIIILFSFNIFIFRLNAQNNINYEMKTVSEEAFLSILQFFQYDKQISLDARVIERKELPLYIKEKIVFLGSHDSRVPGFLIIPKSGTAPYPCILLLHGHAAGGKSAWFEKDSLGALAFSLLSEGYALLALDAQYEGERVLNNDYESSIVFIWRGWFNKFRETLIQSVIDYRRGLDYLTTRSEIDTNRIGVFGYSFGGIMTFLLTGVEPRVKVAVAAVTPLMGKGSPADNSEFDLYSLSAITPRNYARAINNRPFLMLMGKHDFYYTTDEAKQVFDLIDSQRKNIIFYDSEHQLPIDHIKRVNEWFQKYL